MSNIVWHNTAVSQQDRILQKNHKPVVLWYTGLSGSGKSTIANAVDKLLHDKGYHTYILDGDNVRHGLNKDLGFSDTDRIENIRRISEIANLFVDAGIVVSTAFISPFISDREQAKELIGQDNFVEIFIDTDLQECKKRDPKGLYKKVRSGDIPSFTGITSPYEKPPSPNLTMKTDQLSIIESAETIVKFLEDNKLI